MSEYSEKQDREPSPVLFSIDVLMGVYNDADRVSKSIDSILQQEFTDWRLLICDDGSTDGTPQKAKKYAEQYPHKILVVRNEENRGLAYSLNRLLKMSNAEYIARMDSDDISLPERFRLQKDFLDKHKDYAVVGSVVTKYDEIGEFGIYRYPEKPEKKDLLFHTPFAHPSIMIRSEVLKKLGGYREIKKVVRCEDYDLWMRFFENDYKGFNIQVPLLKYYEGRTSYKKRKFRYRINEMRMRFDGFKRNGLMPIGIPYAIKPIIVGLIPQKLLAVVRRKQSFSD